ncbi:AAA family ATPase [Nocardia beijingensis]
MSRSNDGLPMLPPWLSESDVSQSGYEAPVQNLPHDDLIEETPSRRRGRFKNRAPEAERPEAARPEKRRKGWRRDKNEGPAEEDQRHGEASRAPAPVPDEPAPARPPQESWQQPQESWQQPHESWQQPHESWQQPQESWQQTGHDRTPPAQDNSWQAPPERGNAPQHNLPTRNPSRPSPGFQPLGSRAANPPGPNDQPAHRQPDRPDLPPPPPRQPAEERPAATRNDEHARPSHGQSAPGQAVGRPPLGPQHGGWPSTGNPRLDAALSAVAPSLWPNSAPPGRAAGTGPTGNEAAQPGAGSPRPAPQPWTTPAPTSGDTSAQSPDPAAPPSPTDQAAWPGGHSPTATPTPPTPPSELATGAAAAPTSVEQPDPHSAQAAAPTGTPPTGTAGPSGGTTAGGVPTGPDQATRHNAPLPTTPGTQPAPGEAPATSGAPSAASGAPTDPDHATRHNAPPTTPGTQAASSEVSTASGAPAGADSSARESAAPVSGEDSGEPQGEQSGVAADKQTRQYADRVSAPGGGSTASTGADPVREAGRPGAPGAGRPSSGASPAEPRGENTAAGSSAAAAQAPATTAATEFGQGTSYITPSSDADQTPSSAQHSAEGPQAASAAPPAVTSDGPPPWLAASTPEQAAASATDAPGPLPPLPDPPRTGGSGSPTAAPDEHRLPPRGADGPPPWLGHSAPEQGRSDRPGLPPTPQETAAPADRAPETHTPADHRLPSHPLPADHGVTEPAPSGPHTGQGGLTVPPGPHSAAATRAPAAAHTPETPANPNASESADLVGAQGNASAPAPSWTSATEVGHRPVAGGGRHRLSAEPNEPSASQAPVGQAPGFDQQPVPQSRPETAYVSDGPQQPPYGASDVTAVSPTQFAGTRAPGTPPQAPADQWRNAAAPESAAATPHSAPPHQIAGQAAPQWGAPPGYAQPPAQQQGTPLQQQGAPLQQQGSPLQQQGAPLPQQGAPLPQQGVPLQQQGGPFQQPSLDNVPLRRAKKAPGTGWRKAVHHVSGGAINPGMSAEERRLQELVARIRQPVRGDYRIAVLSLKGGVGKTTTTMGLGSTFASIRGDRVIAVDANPDFGTLSQRVPLQTRSTVRDLLLDSTIQRYSDVRRHTSQATSRLEVLASERDPAASEAFSEEEYRAVARILQRFYNIILTDCGTGLMHSAMSGVLDLAHSLVLISSPAIDGARSAAATLDWLSLHGHDHLVRNAVVVINSPRAGSPNVGIQQLREYFLSRCRAVHIIPFDAHMSEGAEIDLHRLHKQTKRAYVELAATVADDFATDHRRYHP